MNKLFKFRGDHKNKEKNPSLYWYCVASSEEHARKRLLEEHSVTTNDLLETHPLGKYWQENYKELS